MIELAANRTNNEKLLQQVRFLAEFPRRFDAAAAAGSPSNVGGVTVVLVLLLVTVTVSDCPKRKKTLGEGFWRSKTLLKMGKTDHATDRDQLSGFP